MKIYNMRNNDTICEINDAQHNFLKTYFHNENEDDNEFFITIKTMKTLEEKANSEEETKLCKVLKDVLNKESGKVGLDFYIE